MPAVKVDLLDEASRLFEVPDTWWRRHRDAKDLFVDELEQALKDLAASPEIGQRYRWVRGKMIQRWLLKKTGFHVYYFHDAASDLLEVHSIWGARRRRGPRL